MSKIWATWDRYRLNKQITGFVPIFKNDEAVAMVIESARFDRDWASRGKPAVEEDSTSGEELLRLLMEHCG